MENAAASIFWAVDAFHEKPSAQLHCFEALTKLFGKRKFSVKPVSVLSLGRYNPETMEFSEEWPDLYVAAQKHLDKLFSVVKHPALQPPTLLRQKGSSIYAAAQQFLAFATQHNAQLLVVGSHARQGLERVLMGSFSESLVLQSPLPVLVVNPLSKAKTVKRIKKILFPTDFSTASNQAFSRTTLLAKALNIPIELYHRVQYLYPDVAPPFFYPAVSADSLRDARTDLTKQATQWQTYAKTQGVRVTFRLDSHSASPLQGVLAELKKLGPATMLSIASQSNRAEAILLGSLTRKILRTATSPVLVMHPDQESVAKRFATEAKLAGYHLSASPPFF